MYIVISIILEVKRKKIKKKATRVIQTVKGALSKVSVPVHINTDDNALLVFRAAVFGIAVSTELR